MRALRGCAMVPFSSRDLLPVAMLLVRSGSSDVVKAFVAVTAAQAGLERAGQLCADEVA